MVICQSPLHMLQVFVEASKGYKMPLKSLNFQDILLLKLTMIIIISNYNQQYLIYGHFLSTCDLPDSSYSCLLIHICWKDPRDARMEPPIQEPNLLSVVPVEEINLNLMLGGVRLDRSRLRRSTKPFRSEFPPVTITPEQRLGRRSMSHRPMLVDTT